MARIRRTTLEIEALRDQLLDLVKRGYRQVDTAATVGISLGYANELIFGTEASKIMPPQTELQKKILAYKGTGYDIKEIAKELNCSLIYVSKVLRNQAYSLERINREARAKYIVDRFLEGYSAIDLANALGISRYIVYNALYDAKVDIKGTKKELRELRKAMRAAGTYELKPDVRLITKAEPTPLATVKNFTTYAKTKEKLEKLAKEWEESRKQDSPSEANDILSPTNKKEVKVYINNATYTPTPVKPITPKYNFFQRLYMGIRNVLGSLW